MTLSTLDMDSFQSYLIPYAGVYCPCCSQPKLHNNDCQIDLATSGDGQKYYTYQGEGVKGVKGQNKSQSQRHTMGAYHPHKTTPY